MLLTEKQPRPKETALRCGFTLVDPLTVIATHRIIFMSLLQWKNK